MTEELRITLGFLERLTLVPNEVAAMDMLDMKTGPSYQAMVDAIYICAGFNIINRVADALGFRMPPATAFAGITWFLLTFGYRLLSGSGIWTMRRQGGPLAEDVHSVPIDEGMLDPYSPKLRRLKSAVLSAPGTLDRSIRLAASRSTAVPEVLAPYVEKVAQAAYEVTDEDIEALLQVGYTQDQIFEATVSTAVGAGLLRIEAGLAALKRST